MTIELSIVMATYNRSNTIVRTIEHLTNQDIDPSLFELIIVDDASPDDTAKVIQNLIPSLPYRTTYFRNETNRGPGYTQNRGIEAVKSPLLMIMTDDVFMNPCAIRYHLEFHRQFPGLEHAALGKVLQSPELKDSALMRNWDPFRFWLLDGAEQLPFYMFWACNVSCKLNLMKRAGMFKEHAGRGGPVAFEDLEVGYRLSQESMNLHYIDGASGYHYHPYTIDQAIQRWHERGLNFNEFRKSVPTPELSVYFHLLNRKTFREYYHVLSTENMFEGKERSFTWHIFRTIIQRIVLNRITEPLFWRPILYLAEKNTLIERLVTRQVYRAYFYYHFLRGVNDSYRIYS